MLNSKSFLAIDFGAGSLKLAEFQQNDAGGLRLAQYGIKPLGMEGAIESSREGAIKKALQESVLPKWAARCSANCVTDFNATVGKVVGLTAKK